MGLKCHQCQAPLYSRRTKICDGCGAPVPAEQLLSDEAARQREDERAWARQIAGRFDGPSRAAERDELSVQTVPDAPRPPLTEEEAIALLPRDFAAEFKHRKRRSFPLYILGFALFLVPLFIINASTFQIRPSTWLVVLLLPLIPLAFNWNSASPTCPNCRQNIRVCHPEHCHICGKQLKDKSCPSCNVHYSLPRRLLTGGGGLLYNIDYCPGCGVFLDTNIRRWEAGSDNGGS